MKRCIDLIAAVLLMVVTAPLLLLGWLGLKLRRAQPVFIRSDGTADFPAGVLMFNSSGNGHFPAFLRTSSIDHLPVLFDVLAGEAGLGDVFRHLSRISKIRHQPPTRRELILRLVGLFIAACIFGVLAYYALRSV